MSHNFILDAFSISKTYHSGSVSFQALKQVNIKLRQGSFTSLVGPSGSGKSTLLNICGLIDVADTGRLIFEGTDLAHSDMRTLTMIRRRKLGFIFQEFNLIPVMSIRENIEYPLFLIDTPWVERQQRVDEMLHCVGLEQFADYLPDQLSGGQKQRVAVARAIIMRPRLVIGDEPTANLDSETASIIITLMQRMCREFCTTFIIATHDERMSSRCDCQIRLLDGRVMEAGTGTLPS